MSMTQREFRIAVGAALFGFFLCYFLFGTTTPPRSPSPKMTVIASLPKPAQTNLPFQLFSPPTTNRQLIRSGSSFGFKDRPELRGYRSGSLKFDLTSSRYEAEVDLADLQ